MKKLAKSLVIVFVITILSKILGLIREIVLANQFGTSYIVDAYTVAISLPSVFFSIFASGIANSYIPIYSRLGEDKEKGFFSNVITVLTSISLVICVLVLAFSRWITHIVVPGFNGRVFDTTWCFICIIVWALPFMVIFNVLMAHAQVNEDFAFPNFCNQIVLNLIIIISIQIAAIICNTFLVIGYVLAYLVATLLLIIYLRYKNKLQYKLTFSLRDDDFKRLIELAMPMGGSILINQINSVTDKTFASLLGEGVTSALSYANRVQLIPHSLVVATVMTLCYPRMNRCFAKGDKLEGLGYAEKSITIALYVGIPVVLYFFAFSRNITSILFERGAFSTKATMITATSLLFYSIGIPFYLAREILSRVLSANLKQKLILKNTIISVLCNVILDFVLALYCGYIGLPLATSITGLIALILTMKDLAGIDLRVSLKKHLDDIIKVVIISIISVSVCWGIKVFLQTMINEKVSFVIGVLLSWMVYLLLGFVLKIKIVLWSYGYLTEGIRTRGECDNY